MSDQKPLSANHTPKNHSVVLFHGLCSSPLEVSFLAANLKKEGYEVFTPSFEGYAYGSPCTDADQWSDAAIEYVRQIQQNTTGSVSVGGISMGAVMALSVAERLENLHGLILLSPSLIIDGWAIPWYRFFIPLGMALGLGDRFKYGEQEPFGVKNPQMRAYIRRQLENQAVSAAGGASFTLRHLYQGDQLCKKVRERLPQITTNTLIIHAIDDEVATVRNVKLIQNEIKSPICRTIYLGNSYHMITIDNERETVDFEVSNFLETSGMDFQNLDQIVNQYGIASPELQRYLKNNFN